MRKYLAICGFLFCVTSSFLACKHDVPKPAIPTSGNPTNPGDTSKPTNPNPTNSDDTALCFERDILPIFISNCAKSGCHDAATRQEGFEFTSYTTITSKKFKPGDLDDTELWEKITENDHDKRMPPPPNAPLTSQQIALIRDWILRGAPNGTNCPMPCDSSKYKFAADIQPMINTYCKGCHNSVTLSGGYSYETYQGILEPIQNGRFLGAIKHQRGYSPMPRGGSKLTDCQIQKIENWIANGARND